MKLTPEAIEATRRRAQEPIRRQVLVIGATYPDDVAALRAYYAAEDARVAANDPAQADRVNGRRNAQADSDPVAVEPETKTRQKGSEGPSRACFEFTVPGTPRPKGRPRFGRNRKTGRPVTFTDPQTVRYEKAVGNAAKAAGVPLLDGPVALRVEVFLPDRRCADLDNLVKAVMDGLNKVAWRDDSQVVRLVATKAVRPEALGVKVRIEPAGAATPRENLQGCSEGVP